MMYGDAIKAAQNLASIVPFLGGSTSRKDYEEAIKMVEYLVEHEPDSPLVNMLTAQIDEYEDNAPEFAEFNARIALYEYFPALEVCKEHHSQIPAAYINHPPFFPVLHPVQARKRLF